MSSKALKQCGSTGNVYRSQRSKAGLSIQEQEDCTCDRGLPSMPGCVARNLHIELCTHSKPPPCSLVHTKEAMLWLMSGKAQGQVLMPLYKWPMLQQATILQPYLLGSDPP